LLADYLNAIPYLTIGEENRLKRQVEELTSRRDEISFMKLKHETEMKEMREQIQILIQSRNETNELLKYPEKLAQIAKHKQ